MYSRLPRATDHALLPALGVLILAGCSGYNEAATKVTFEIETLERNKLTGKLIVS